MSDRYQHQAQAEHLLALIYRRGLHDNGEPIVNADPTLGEDMAIIGLAQVHAILALSNVGLPGATSWPVDEVAGNDLVG